MKYLIVVLLFFITLFFLYRIYAQGDSKKIEEYPYQLIKSYDTFETRAYEARLFSSVKLKTSNYDKASGNGFRILAGYIFGGNDRNEQIAMTSPVAMSLEDSITMMFMIPKKFKEEELPSPNQKEIEFKNMPAKKMAAITFSGWASQDRIEKYKQKLIENLKEEGIMHTSKFLYFGYNPPYELVNRRNEVLVELE